MRNNDTDTKPHITDLIHAIKGEPSIRVLEVFNDATDPNKVPYWELDPRFLNPFAEVAEVLTWCRIGNRPALEKSGITTIASKPKEGKSASMYALLMHLIAGKPFGNMEPVCEPPRLIIIFDTEMSKNYLIRRYRLIRKTIGDEGANKLRIVPLKGVPKGERMELIADMVERYDPEIIAFDTVTRLISNFNDAQENIDFAELILPMSENRSIIAITHLTYNTDKMKGHLGSQLEEVANENYSVKKENGIIQMIAKNARNTDTENAPAFQFLLTSEGGIIDARAMVEQLEAEKYQAWRSNFQQLFDTTLAEDLSYKELTSLIMTKEGLGERDAQTKISTAYKLGVLDKERKGQNVFYRLKDPIA